MCLRRARVCTWIVTLAACGSDARDPSGAPAAGPPTGAFGPVSVGDAAAFDAGSAVDAAALPTDAPLRLAWSKTFVGPGVGSGVGLVDLAGQTVVMTQLSEPVTFGQGETGEVTLSPELASSVALTWLGRSGEMLRSKLTTQRPGGPTNGGTFSGGLALVPTGFVGLSSVSGTREFGSGEPGAITVAAPPNALWATFSRYDDDGKLMWLRATGGERFEATAFTSVADTAMTVGGRVSGTVTIGEGAKTRSFTGSASDRVMAIAHFDASGELVWARSAGPWARVYGLAHRAADGALFVAGTFRGTLALGNGEATQTTLVSNAFDPDDVSGFVARFAGDGKLVWAKAIGDGVVATQLALTPGGGFVVAGTFDRTRTVLGTVKTAAAAAPIHRDAFAAKLDDAGDVTWLKQVGGEGDDVAGPLRVDDAGHTWFVVDATDSSSFSVAQEATLISQAPLHQSVIVVFDGAGAGDVRRLESLGTAMSVSEIAVKPGFLMLGGVVFQGAALRGKPVPVVGATDTFVARYDR